jgi:hypothetical protein
VVYVSGFDRNDTGVLELSAMCQVDAVSQYGWYG